MLTMAYGDETERPNPDPRKSFKTDLDAFLAPHHAVGTELLIMGDFNETVGESPKASTHS
jgi:hypothetical protein